LNYHDVLKIDTGLADKSLESLDVNTGCFVPHNLKDKVVTHFTADNIDINDSIKGFENKFRKTYINSLPWRPFSILTDTVHYVLTHAEDFGLFCTL
jgi:hypothetical protein